MLADIHLHPGLSVPLAALLASGAIWQMLVQFRAGVPRGRRVIRVSAAVLMLVGLGLGVVGLSVMDPAVQRRSYMLVWTALVGVMMLLVGVALADLVHSMRLLERTLDAERDESRQRARR